MPGCWNESRRKTAVTDHTLARADEVLTELVELVETARTLPMSSSCVVPRERTLDLLDALREVLPSEMMEARRLVAQRDRLLAEATERAEELARAATEEANAVIDTARADAHNRIETAKTEQAQLVASATVHQTATAEAGRITAMADAHAETTRREAEEYAGRLKADAHGYAERTLSELVANLQRLAATAENGRAALGGSAAAEPPPEPDPGIGPVTDGSHDAG
jgi:cell division septum initiation protein DivIVA